MNKLVLVGVALPLALVAAGCGSSKDDAPAVSGSPQTIEVEMRDIAFSPTTITVKAGRAITFRFTNTGKVEHEAILGDTHVQAEHEDEMMTSTTGMSDHGGMGMADSDSVTVAPGKVGELTHTFTTSEDGTLIGCHEPGHYAAGMKIKVHVTS